MKKTQVVDYCFFLSQKTFPYFLFWRFVGALDISVPKGKLASSSRRNAIVEILNATTFKAQPTSRFDWTDIVLLLRCCSSAASSAAVIFLRLKNACMRVH